MMNVADYGQLGHGEVVGVDIPESAVKGFADQYFSLFGKDSERPDKVSNFFHHVRVVFWSDSCEAVRFLKKRSFWLAHRFYSLLILLSAQSYITLP